MKCCDCKYLKYDDKKNGDVSGCLYYCYNIQKYINGTNEVCENYCKDYARKIYESDEIYNDGKNYYNDSTPTSTYVFIAVILIIIAFIVNVFKL